MVSTLNLDEKFNRVRRNFCFYLDIQDNGLARYLSRRIQDMGLQQEWCLSSRVTHVVRAAAAAPDAMLRGRRGPASPAHKYVQLTVQKAISLLDKLYDTFFKTPRKAHVRFFTKHFIKIEFLDKVCRPVYKEFDEWPRVSLDPDPPKEKKEYQENPPTADQKDTPGQKMTRKSRPRIKEREDKEQKGGYCEMCNTEYADGGAHLRSPHHAAFVKDNHNFLALDSLIGAGADVETFLTKTNGERPSRPKRVYQVLGVAKLRSSGSFAASPLPPPTTNGHDPLLVKFRKVRRSELSVLSDEAEQFMFPKRASSTSSTSSSEEEPLPKPPTPKRRSPPQPTQPTPDRRRLARPLALKEESSEEDSWVEDKRRRKRRVAPVAKKGRRSRAPTVESNDNKEVAKEETTPEAPPVPKTDPVVNPLREEPIQKCMKWEDGKLKYTPAVEQLEFAFESVPASEPWYETFRRQDQDKVIVRNIPQYFELYSSKAPPKLPYEIGQLPPLKPNCCPLSDLIAKKEDKSGPSRAYGTRGMKKQRIRKRTAELLALEGHPRKSPREHASTLAILGSAGLLNRRKHAEDSKSTASEDTISDTQSNVKVEPVVSETQAASERLKQFLSEVFEEATEFDMSDEGFDGDMPLITSTNVPDVSSLVSECDNCDIIHNEIKAETTERCRGRRGKFKKKNRTGWPNKKKQNKKISRNNSLESDLKESSLDRSSAEPLDEDTMQSTLSGDDALSGNEKTLDAKSEDESQNNEETLTAKEIETEPESMEIDDNPDTNESEDKEEKRTSRSSVSDAEDKEIRKKRRALQGLLLQPVVRVARVDPIASARTLRSRRR